ncbi:MAG: peptide chain release factor N(5)-glutamine methyltransferase [Pseudomonadota bacterium]
MEKPPYSKSPYADAALTLGELINQGQRKIEAVSSSARLDCEILLRHVLGISRSALLASLRDPCEDLEAKRYLDLVERRALGEPVAYITGEREFWGLSFKVTPDVLIPRPETEELVARALALLGSRQRVKILDLGTGSGCISIALVSELRLRMGNSLGSGCSLRCDAVDISPAALNVARQNAALHGVSGEIRFVESDWFSNLEQFDPPYDCIIANPPYIDPKESLPIDLKYEPSSALFSKDYGLRDTAEILRGGVALLAADGFLLCEVGAGKQALLPKLLEPYRSRGFACNVLGDASNLDHFAFIELL